MFQSKKSRRRQSKSGSSKQRGARSRRLRVELMERRLMLAAAPLDGVQPEIHPIEQSWASDQFHLTAAAISFPLQSTDGGFVGVAGINDAVTDVFASGTLDATGEQSLRIVIGQDTNLRITRAAFGWVSPTGAIALGMTLSDYLGPNETTVLGPTIPSVSPVGDSGLNAVVIVPELNNDSGSSLSPLDMKPVVIGPSPSQPSPSLPGPSLPGSTEGGSIPIHAIFADFRQDGHLASGVKSVSSLLTEASIDLQASAHVTSTSNDAVAGEWARATVFEIAGGEPSALTSLGEKSTNTPGNGDPILQSDPLSTIESPHQSTGHRATSSQAGATDGQVGQQSAQPEDLIAADDAPTNLPDRANPADTSDRRIAPPTFEGSIRLASATNPETAAVEAVFHRLGEDKAVVVESNLHGKSWLHSIGTSPLLIALALERIAALNSRRARREAKVSPLKLSPRSPA